MADAAVNAISVIDSKALNAVLEAEKSGQPRADPAALFVVVEYAAGTGTAEDYQPRHFVQSLAVTSGDGGLWNVVANFVVFYTTNGGDSRILTTGEYHDTVRIAGDQALVVSKKAILDQVTVPRYLVYPI